MELRFYGPVYMVLDVAAVSAVLDRDLNEERARFAREAGSSASLGMTTRKAKA